MGVEIVARISGSGLRLGAVFGGLPAISMEELMGALAGLEPGPELAIRVAVCGQADMVKALELTTAVELSGVAARNGWRMVTGKPVLRSMAARAVAELADPKIYFCPACGGSGKRTPTPKNPSCECPRCNGYATIEPSGRQMAELIGIDEATWRRTWSGRMQSARDIINGWLGEAIIHVHSKLKDDA